MTVYAQCPVCIVTVGGGMLLARKLGIDDLLVSIWISALNTVIAFWLAPKFKIQFLKNPYILSLILLGFTLFYFDFTGQISSVDKVLGINKLILGNLLGLIGIFIGNYLYAFTKARNGHRALFPYQKVIFPFASVLILTLIFKFAFRL